jgi:hypothetical protein
MMTPIRLTPHCRHQLRRGSIACKDRAKEDTFHLAYKLARDDGMYASAETFMRPSGRAWVERIYALKSELHDPCPANSRSHSIGSPSNSDLTSGSLLPSSAELYMSVVRFGYSRRIQSSPEAI